MPEPYQLDVVEVIEETADARSFVLRGEKRLSYRPGQFLTIRLPGPASRCYSLAGCPFTDALLKVTVKRVAGGYGSNWLCDEVRVGDTLDVLPPTGTFTPRDMDGDFLLVAGGSGITPLMSIAKSVLHAGRGRVVLVYTNRDERSVIYREELRELAAAQTRRLLVVHRLDSVQGLPTGAQLAELAQPYTSHETFACGPEVLMDAFEEAVGRHIHRERFFSLGEDAFETAGQTGDEGDRRAGTEPCEARIELDGERHRVPWPANLPLLDAMLAAGLDAPYSCREGLCNACACRIVSGEVEMRHNEVLDERDLAEGYVLACQSVPLTTEVRVRFS